MVHMLANSALAELNQDCEFTGNVSPGKKSETLEKEGRREKHLLHRVPCTVHLKVTL